MFGDSVDVIAHAAARINEENHVNWAAIARLNNLLREPTHHLAKLRLIDSRLIFRFIFGIEDCLVICSCPDVNQRRGAFLRAHESTAPFCPVTATAGDIRSRSCRQFASDVL